VDGRTVYSVQCTDERATEPLQYDSVTKPLSSLYTDRQSIPIRAKKSFDSIRFGNLINFPLVH